MQELWGTYLDQLGILDDIKELVVYTDHWRFWFLGGLLDLADHMDWRSSLQIIEEITDEEGMEIRQSLGVLPDTCLLVANFSQYNPVIEELQSIFPLLQPPFGFSGFSLITHQYLADHFFVHHLSHDLFASEELLEEIKDELVGGLSLSSESVFLSGAISSMAHYPFRSSSHTLFPGTELVIGLEMKSVEGTIDRILSIGAVIDRDELIDPFGTVSTDLSMLVEQGQIVDIRGNALLSKRIENCITLPTSFTQLQLSIGLGPEGELTGMIEHDRLLKGVMTLSFYEESRSLYFECTIGQFPL